MNIGQRGFTLIEQLVAVAIIGGVCLIAIQLSDAMYTSYKRSSNLQQISNLRSSMRLLLENDSAWAYTLQAGANATSFACILNGTDCSSVPPSNFALYDANGTLFYNPDTPGAGLTPSGAICTGFNPTKSNDACPIGVKMTWTPLCPGNTEFCNSPNIIVDMQYIIPSKSNGLIPSSINRDKLDFRLLRSSLFCSAKVVDYTQPASWTATGTVINTNPVFTIRSTNPTVYGGANSALATATLHACDQQAVVFGQSMMFTGGAQATDAANAASVCLADASSSQCDFDWRQTNSTWSLWQTPVGGGPATQVFSQPPGSSYSASTIFEMRVQNGLVKFFVNGVLAYIFPRPRYKDYIFRVTPPPANYSNGITIFSF